MLCGGFSAVGLRVRGARWWYRGLQARRLRHRSVPTNRRWRADRAIQIVTVLARGRVTSQAGGGSARKVLLARACLGKLAIGCWALRRACSSPSARGEWGSTWLRTAGCSTQHRAPRHLACVQVAGHARDRPRCPERSCAPTLKVRYHLCTYYTYVYTAYRLSLIVAHCCFAPVWPHLRKVDWNKAEPSQRR